MGMADVMTAAELIAFEAEIADRFNAGEIRAPVHLSGGNEAQLIDYFTRYFRPGDWVFSTWRSHYHALLAGVPPERVRAAILAGRSITLTFPEHRFLTSAIVGGTLPIALGVALGIKRTRLWNWKLAGWDPLGETARDDLKARPLERVHCFIGDMTSRTGAFEECTRYAAGHQFPINWIVEDNGKSVLTDTVEVWGWPSEACAAARPPQDVVRNITRYAYHLPWPHSGAGKRVEF
jgi:TPP-dependent pyruvate/acetoin dehydrogenase alpha subunit